MTHYVIVRGNGRGNTERPSLEEVVNERAAQGYKVVVISFRYDQVLMAKEPEEEEDD